MNVDEFIDLFICQFDYKPSTICTKILLKALSFETFSKEAAQGRTHYENNYAYRMDGKLKADKCKINNSLSSLPAYPLSGPSMLHKGN